MPIYRFYIFIVLVFLLNNKESYSIEGQTYKNEDDAFNYDVDFRLIWIDALQRANRSSSVNSGPAFYVSEENTNIKKFRSLGLERLQVGLNWKVANKSSLQLFLRPDATLQRSDSNENSKKMDSRAGSVYRAESRIDLLDSYLLSYFLDPLNSEISFGVFDKISPIRMAYEPLMKFGLLVKLPEKTSGARVSWNTQTRLENINGASNKTLRTWELYVFQGHNEKVEYLGRMDRSFDEAPASKNPYMGTALSVGLSSKYFRELSLLLGYGASEIESVKVRETFVSAFLIQNYSLLGKQVLLNFDFRYSSENWLDSDISLKPLKQMNFSASSKISLKPKQNLNFAFHYGESERHSVSDQRLKTMYTGKQIELAWEYMFLPNLLSQFFVSEEYRDFYNENNELQPGFHSGTKSQRMLRRIGISVQYQIAQGT